MNTARKKPGPKPRPKPSADPPKPLPGKRVHGCHDCHYCNVVEGQASCCHNAPVLDGWPPVKLDYWCGQWADRRRPPTLDNMLTPHEVARLMRLDPFDVQSMCERKLLRAYLVDHQWRIPQTAILEYLQGPASALDGEPFDV